MKDEPNTDEFWMIKTATPVSYPSSLCPNSSDTSMEIHLHFRADGVEPEPIGLGDMLFGEENEEFDNGINDSNNEDGQAGATSPVEKLKGHPRRFWRVDTPLRVEPPPSFNAPLRPVEQTREQQIKVSP